MEHRVSVDATGFAKAERRVDLLRHPPPGTKAICCTRRRFWGRKPVKLAKFRDHEHERELWINIDMILKIVPEIRAVQSPGSDAPAWKRTGRSHVHLAGGHDAGGKATNPDVVVIDMPADQIAEYIEGLAR
jgi:hypothetical protein